jgi:hypothetical protein
MGRKRLTPDQEYELKFEDCAACKLVLSKACKTCAVGENFVDADEPEDTFEFMERWS